MGYCCCLLRCWVLSFSLKTKAPFGSEKSVLEGGGRDAEGAGAVSIVTGRLMLVLGCISNLGRKGSLGSLEYEVCRGWRRWGGDGALGLGGSVRCGAGCWVFTVVRKFLGWSSK